MYKIKELLKNNENYIFGAGKCAEAIYKVLSSEKIEIVNFIDRNLNGHYIFGKKILSLSEISNKKANIIIGSINYMYDMEKEARTACFSNIISYGKLVRIYKELQSFNQAFYGLCEDYQNNKEKYEAVRKLFADEKSQKVLDTIIEYRKTLDISLYSKIADNINRQYFEEFMPKNMDVFIDGGGFDGDTVKRCLEYFSPSKIYFFEPDKISYNKAKNNLKHVKNIEYFPYGLSDKHKILKFNAIGESGSCFDCSGNSEIECISLDDIVKEDRALIKLDIEGAEIEAICGAKRLLKNNSPFAICVYHKPSDIWKIPELLIKILYNSSLETKKQDKFRFYLRHYTNTVFETVLYGVPSYG